jgi:hypothetical protein
MTENSAADTKANAGSGWDEEVETKGAESQQAVDVPKPEDTEDQVLNTKLGRKVKAQEERLEELKTQNQQILEAVQRLESIRNETPAEKSGDAQSRIGDDLYDRMCAIEPPPVEFVTTPKEQVQMAQWEKRVSAKMEQQYKGVYEGSYIKAANSLKDDGGDLHEEVIRLITTNTPYNVSRGSGRGDLDAQLNYHSALSALLSGKVKAAGTFGNNGGNQVKAGVTAQSFSSNTGKKPVTLSAEAAEYARYLGYTDDQISESMDRPIVTK